MNASSRTIVLIWDHLILLKLLSMDLFKFQAPRVKKEKCLGMLQLMMILSSAQEDLTVMMLEKVTQLDGSWNTPSIDLFSSLVTKLELLMILRRETQHHGVFITKNSQTKKISSRKFILLKTEDSVMIDLSINNLSLPKEMKSGPTLLSLKSTEPSMKELSSAKLPNSWF